jgi:hypothetical protein
MRSLMRRLGALALAVGLLPAASGGAACVAHWVGGDLHAQSAAQTSRVHATHEDATSGHAAHEHATHEDATSGHAAHEHAAHMAPEHAAYAHGAHANGAHADPSPDAPPAHDAEAPCTALAACGVLAAVESPARALSPNAPAVAVRSGEHLAPPGPAPAPDVPPPRR